MPCIDPKLASSTLTQCIEHSVAYRRVLLSCQHYYTMSADDQDSEHDVCLLMKIIILISAFE